MFQAFRLFTIPFLYITGSALSISLTRYSTCTAVQPWENSYTKKKIPIGSLNKYFLHSLLKVDKPTVLRTNNQYLFFMVNEVLLFFMVNEVLSCTLQFRIIKQSDIRFINFLNWNQYGKFETITRKIENSN